MMSRIPFKYTRELSAALMLLILFGGCGSREPAGKPVELTQEDKRKARFAHDAKELWAAWHMKGTRLSNEGKLDEALYCFNQAMAAWPKTFEDDGGEVHPPEPGDTLLQKGYLYLKMKEPKLALKYFEKFDSYRPGTKVARDGMANAKAMME